MKKKYLLGATSDNELVFGEFEITHRNGYAEFTASFNTVKPFNGDDFDLEECLKDTLLVYWDKETLYDECVRFDCKPSELAEYLANEYNDVRDVLDCSLYPERYIVDVDFWYFESGSCGQHDTRNDMEEIINPEAYNLLHKLWDAYHLKEVDDEVISQVESLEAMLAEVDEEEWIVDYIQRHMEDFE